MLDPKPNTPAILLDVEGTTTPIAFVHDVLFSYVRSHLHSYLAAHASEEALKADLIKLRNEYDEDVMRHEGPPRVIYGEDPTGTDSMADYVEWLMDRDRKSTALKSLQGKIWREGYLDGSLKAPIFPDVHAAFRRWQTAKKTICIFSSGSVLAQKLLFAHTTAGDLTSFISDYFDTETGKKDQVTSYVRIAGHLKLDTAQILFISDVTAEIDAAQAAGMQALLCFRPGNPEPPNASSYEVIDSFAEL